MHVVVGALIKHLREQKKMSRRELASKISVAPQTIAQLESGSRDLTHDYLIKLSYAFGISSEALVLGLLRTPEELDEEHKRMFETVQKQLLFGLCYPTGIAV